MTREDFWEIVTTKLVWVDYWNGESEPSDEVKEILTNSLLIPKPRFKVGDVVSIPSGYSNGFTVYSRVYSPDKNMWFYSPNYEDNNSSMFLRLPELPAPKECFDEDELELVERKEDES